MVVARVVVDLVDNDVREGVVAGVLSARWRWIIVQSRLVGATRDHTAAIVGSGIGVVVVGGRIRTSGDVGARTIVFRGQRPVVGERRIGATQAHHVCGIAWLNFPVAVGIACWGCHAVGPACFHHSCAKGVVGAVIHTCSATAVVDAPLRKTKIRVVASAVTESNTASHSSKLTSPVASTSAAGNGLPEEITLMVGLGK